MPKIQWIDAERAGQMLPGKPSGASMRRYARLGLLKPPIVVRTPGGRYWFHPDELRRYVDNGCTIKETA